MTRKFEENLFRVLSLQFYNLLVIFWQFSPILSQFVHAVQFTANLSVPQIKSCGIRCADLTLSDDDRCYKYLPVVVRQNGQTPDKRFLIPGSRLLSNISDLEPCEAALKVPRGYLTTKGHWLAMSPRPRVLVPPAELQIEILTTPDTYETEAQGGAYMDRDLAEWARAFAWDTQRTITQTHEGRISQAMSFANQFQEGFSRDQFSRYLDTIEAQASFMSFLNPIQGISHPQADLHRILVQRGHLLLHRSHVTTWSLSICSTIQVGSGDGLSGHRHEVALLRPCGHPGGRDVSTLLRSQHGS